jgi:high-affinity iron transporter
MLIDSVVIVLREVLEAALLISVLLAATRRLATPGPSLRLAAGLGICGAWLFGAAMRPISGWFDGVGFEVVNSFLQLAIYIAIVTIIGLLGAGAGTGARRAGAALSWAMVAAVSLAIVREGAEILLYFSGFIHRIGATADVLTGAVLGLGVGFSTGALFYYLLIALPPPWALRVAVGLLVLVGAGMCAQAVKLLIQADWLPAQGPLWDTSRWLPEQSLPGQLLYALIGYEATPTPLQVILYLASAAIALAVFAIATRCSVAKA